MLAGTREAGEGKSAPGTSTLAALTAAAMITACGGEAPTGPEQNVSEPRAAHSLPNCVVIHSAETTREANRETLHIDFDRDRPIPTGGCGSNAWPEDGITTTAGFPRLTENIRGGDFPPRSGDRVLFFDEIDRRRGVSFLFGDFHRSDDPPFKAQSIHLFVTASEPVRLVCSDNDFTVQRADTLSTGNAGSSPNEPLEVSADDNVFDQCSVVVLADEPVLGTAIAIDDLTVVRSLDESEDDESITIADIETDNSTADGFPTFTTLTAEKDVEVTADVMPARLSDQVEWQVTPISSSERDPAAPDMADLDQGQSIAWQVPEQNPDELSGYEHPGNFEEKALKFEIVASAQTDDGETITSDPDTVRQDEIDTAREEYVELRSRLGFHRVPDRKEFDPESRCEVVCSNTGDYGVALLNDAFMKRLSVLEDQWAGQWQINTIYRNPVHNNFHGVPGAEPSSWHQFGCAADLQTFPVLRNTDQDRQNARIFWKELAATADSLGFDVESLDRSKVGHVHVEIEDNC